MLQVSCASAERIASGDRSGGLAAWDLASPGRAAWAVPPAHGGHVTALTHLPASAGLASGGQDGCLKIWDCRRALP